jgi:protein-disulfide isomerase
MDSKKKDYILPASILIAAILISGSLIYLAGVKGLKPQTQTAAIQEAAKITSPQIDDDVILGDPQAPVTIFIFSDYQCPFCGKFFKETELLIRKNYVETGKAKMIYKDFAFLGPESIAASQAAECARDQGKYWAYHDAIFNIEIKEFDTLGNNEHTGNLNKEAFKKIASDLKMNVDEFLACFDSQKYAAEVERDIKEANSVMDRASTPTIFINEKIIQGAYPYNIFSQAIDEALSKK